jgi:hypothetical protein
MNTMTFYIARFSTPLAGLVVLAAVGGDVSYRWADPISVAIAAGILAGVLLVLHSDSLAHTVGLRGGRFVRRFRRSVDPEAWAQGCTAFRGHVAARFRYGFPRSLAGVIAMLAVDLTVLILCLRFVGVSGAEASLADIAIAYLFAYPFTFFPFTGIGIVDSLIVASLVETGDLSVEAPARRGPDGVARLHHRRAGPHGRRSGRPVATHEESDGHRRLTPGRAQVAAAAARPATRPENRQPPRKVPSSAL